MIPCVVLRVDPAHGAFGEEIRQWCRLRPLESADDDALRAPRTERGLASCEQVGSGKGDPGLAEGQVRLAEALVDQLFCRCALYGWPWEKEG